MAISKSLFLNFLVICWLGYSQVCGGAGEPLPCIQKLMPCQAYLKGSAPPSPASACCVPLKEMAAGDTHCLCAVFNNKAFLKTLNVTQEDALNLAKTCGATADISICSKEASPPSVPAAPSSNSSEPKKNAGSKASHVGGSVLAAAIFSIIVYLF
ncbi:non-specific lipid transfer protein GPI-anchored 3-like [Salvia miltiorrhiza]|uniref:non-specific lipid transfer protein GPI-anchored 3-like n=1 Tax=Salvia miltiorrhiza TaxID=226208 RepID=UPI0025AD5E0F|nr:non-specific lipid transfer protein GPI-anchored 3-like [Salvia miltiorrhiza]